ncbi:MAG: cysteine desulfurase family protein [Puniceicoccaceae bacterium]
MAYFDWNATTPVLAEARESWLQASEQFWGNPSSAYRLGALAKVELDKARKSVAGNFGVEPSQVLFTSGATESINGFLRAAENRSPANGTIWISAVEHSAVQKAALEFWGKDRVVTMPVDKGGIVELDWIRNNLTDNRPALVALMAVNNETGVIQPWQEVLELCASAGVPFFCDAVQWIGKNPATKAPFAQCAGVSASGHKFGAPKGTGLLILGKDWQGIRIQVGGSQEQDSRAGTENVPGAVALSLALDNRMSLQLSQDQLTARDRFEQKLRQKWKDDLQIHAADAPRTWNTCSVSLPKYKAARWIARLDKRGFQVSAGSACGAGKDKISPVLAAMGVNEDVAARTIRVSSGWETTPEEWDNLFQGIVAVFDDLEAEQPAGGPGQVIEI